MLVKCYVPLKVIFILEYFMDEANQHRDGLESVLRRLQADKDPDVKQCSVVKNESDISTK